MKKTITKGGAIELIETAEEKAGKDKYKAVKKAADLSSSQMKDLVYVLAKRANLL